MKLNFEEHLLYCIGSC